MSQHDMEGPTGDPNSWRVLKPIPQVRRLLDSQPLDPRSPASPPRAVGHYGGPRQPLTAETLDSPIASALQAHPRISGHFRGSRSSPENAIHGPALHTDLGAQGIMSDLCEPRRSSISFGDYHSRLGLRRRASDRIGPLEQARQGYTVVPASFSGPATNNHLFTELPSPGPAALSFPTHMPALTPATSDPSTPAYQTSGDLRMNRSRSDGRAQALVPGVRAAEAARVQNTTPTEYISPYGAYQTPHPHNYMGSPRSSPQGVGRTASQLTTPNVAFSPYPPYQARYEISRDPRSCPTTPADMTTPIGSLPSIEHSHISQSSQHLPSLGAMVSSVHDLLAAGDNGRSPPRSHTGSQITATIAPVSAPHIEDPNVGRDMSAQGHSATISGSTAWNPEGLHTPTVTPPAPTTQKARLQPVVQDQRDVQLETSISQPPKTNPRKRSHSQALYHIAATGSLEQLHPPASPHTYKPLQGVRPLPQRYGQSSEFLHDDPPQDHSRFQRYTSQPRWRLRIDTSARGLGFDGRERNHFPALSSGNTAESPITLDRAGNLISSGSRRVDRRPGNGSIQAVQLSARSAPAFKTTSPYPGRNLPPKTAKAVMHGLPTPTSSKSTPGHDGVGGVARGGLVRPVSAGQDRHTKRSALPDLKLSIPASSDSTLMPPPPTYCSPRSTCPAFPGSSFSFRPATISSAFPASPSINQKNTTPPALAALAASPASKAPMASPSPPASMVSVVPGQPAAQSTPPLSPPTTPFNARQRGRTEPPFNNAEAVPHVCLSRQRSAPPHFQHAVAIPATAPCEKPNGHTDLIPIPARTPSSYVSTLAKQAPSLLSTSPIFTVFVQEPECSTNNSSVDEVMALPPISDKAITSGQGLDEPPNKRARNDSALPVGVRTLVPSDEPLDGVSDSWRGQDFVPPTVSEISVASVQQLDVYSETMTLRRSFLKSIPAYRDRPYDSFFRAQGYESLVNVYDVIAEITRRRLALYENEIVAKWEQAHRANPKRSIE